MKQGNVQLKEGNMGMDMTCAIVEPNLRTSKSLPQEPFARTRYSHKLHCYNDMASPETHPCMSRVHPGPQAWTNAKGDMIITTTQERCTDQHRLHQSPPLLPHRSCTRTRRDGELITLSPNQGLMASCRARQCEGLA